MDALASLDLSFLAPDEVEAIRAVLKRDGDLQKEVDAKRQQSYQELHKMRKLGTQGTQSQGAECTRCRQPLGFFTDRGALCPECKELTCGNCRRNSELVPASMGWVCSFCLIQRQAKYQSGDWFFPISGPSKPEYPSDTLRKVLKAKAPPQSHKKSENASGTLTRNAAGHHPPDSPRTAGKKKRKSRDESGKSTASEGTSSLTASESKPGRRRKGRSSGDISQTADLSTLGAHSGKKSRKRSSEAAAAPGESVPVPENASEPDDEEMFRRFGRNKQPTHLPPSSPKLSHPTKDRSKGIARTPPSAHFRRQGAASAGASGWDLDGAAVDAEEVSPAAALESTSPALLRCASPAPLRSASPAPPVQLRSASPVLPRSASPAPPVALKSTPKKLTKSVVTSAARGGGSPVADTSDKSETERDGKVRNIPTKGDSPQAGESTARLAEDAHVDTAHSDDVIDKPSVLATPVTHSDEPEKATDKPAVTKDAEVVASTVPAAKVLQTSDSIDSPAASRPGDDAEVQPSSSAESKSDSLTAGVTLSAGIESGASDEASDTQSITSMDRDVSPQRRRASSGKGSFSGIQRRTNVRKNRRSGNARHGSDQPSQTVQDAAQQERTGSDVSATASVSSNQEASSDVSAKASVSSNQATSSVPSSRASVSSTTSELDDLPDLTGLSERERARRIAVHRARKRRAEAARAAESQAAEAAEAENVQPAVTKSQADSAAERADVSTDGRQEGASSSSKEESSAAVPEPKASASEKPLVRRSSTVKPKVVSSMPVDEIDPQFENEEFLGSGSEAEEAAPRKLSPKRNQTPPVIYINGKPQQDTVDTSSDSDDDDDDDDGSGEAGGPVRAEGCPLIVAVKSTVGDDSSSESDSPDMNVDDYFAQAKAESAAGATNAAASAVLSSTSVSDDSKFLIYVMDNGVGVSGRVQYELSHVNGQLRVRLTGCAGLEESNLPQCTIHARLYLLPDIGKSGKRQTGHQKFSRDPMFNEEFSYAVGRDDLKWRTLSISLWIRSDDSMHAVFYGSHAVELSGIVLEEAYTNFDEQLVAEVPNADITAAGGRRHSGTLALGLRCHVVDDEDQPPGSCCLEVMVREGNGVSAADPDDLADPFIRAALLPYHPEKVSTAVCRQTLQPFWHEQLSFGDVQLSQLAEYALEVSMWDSNPPFGHDFLGAVRLGLTVASCESAEPSAATATSSWRDVKSHEEKLWQEMMRTPDQWIHGVLELRDITPHSPSALPSV